MTERTELDMSEGTQRQTPVLQWHVAVDGRDEWTGRSASPSADAKDGPLASLAAARDRVREARVSGRVTGPVEVIVHAGRYELTESLHLSGEDLGDAETPITYRAAGDGEVRLSGSARLEGFAPTGDGVLGLSLRDSPSGDLAFDQLCFNGAWLRAARYPNYDPADPVGGGWLYVAGDPVDIYEAGHGVPDRFVTDDPRPATWAKAHDARVVILPRFNWTNDILTVDDIVKATGEVRLGGPATYDIYPGDRFYFENVGEELTEPGEWFVDRQAQMVYLIPPGPMAGAVVETPRLESVIVVDGPIPTEKVATVEKDTWFDHGATMGLQRHPHAFTAGFVTFQGFVIEGCSGDAVVLRHARGCRLLGCTVRTASGFGVRILSGADTAVVDCDIHDVGKGGIEVSGGYRSPFSGQYESCDNAAINNYVHHFGQVYKHVAGVSLNGVGIRVQHNLIHDGPRWGILSRGNDNLIEYNHVRHVSLETADTSGINMVDRDFSMRGTKIKHNVVHDVWGYDRVDGVWISPAFAFGIYLDDWTSGVEIVGNLVYSTPRAGIYLHAGQDNLVEQNLCLSSGSEAFYMSRWSEERELRHCGTHGQGSRRNHMVRNVFGPAESWYRLAGMTGADGETDVESNVWRDNVLINNARRGVRLESDDAEPRFLGEHDWARWQSDGHDRGSVIAAAEEVLSDDGLQVREGGPATQKGIAALPLDQMGVVASPTRATWPLVEVEGAREHPPAARHRPTPTRG